jgi:hypothetical protein
MAHFPWGAWANVRLQTESDAKPSFDPSVEVPHGDLVESLDQIDAPVEVLEPLQLDAVLPLPCRPVRYDRVSASSCRNSSLTCSKYRGLMS